MYYYDFMDIMTRLLSAKYVAEQCDAEVFWKLASQLLLEGATPCYSYDPELVR